MTPAFIFAPVLVQISLTLFMFLLLGKRKSAALRAGVVDAKKTALDNKAWPEDVVKVSNNIDNQFQAPVIFYVLCLLFYVTENVSTPVVVMAWIYALSRLVHGFVHVSSNFVPARLGAFTVSIVTLMIMTAMAFATFASLS